MGQAGKDVKALDSGIDSAAKPVPGLSHSAPPSVQLAKDHALLANSAWCGVVFSIALVVTAVNLIPPVPVGYGVSAQVLTNSKRVETLKRQLAVHRVGQALAMGKQTQLLAVEVLDSHTQIRSARSAAEQEPLTLVEVRSLWPGRTTAGEVRKWLSELTRDTENKSITSPLGSQQRFARWEAQVREHYLKQFRQSSFTDDMTPAKGVVQLASGTSSKPPTRFAALSMTVPPQEASATTAATEIEKTLVRELEIANARCANVAASTAQRASKLEGMLTLSGAPRVRALPGRVPVPMALSIIVLALAGGALGGWANHRAQSGGTFHPVDVANNMHMLGLPLLGCVRLHCAGVAATHSAVRRRISSTRRWAVQKLLSCSELIVLFWCLAIAIRLVLDPLWRAMLWDSPLAALGRLFIGLP